MDKVQKLNEVFIQARKDKNEIAKALFSTLKGEYDTAIKKGLPETDSTIEKLAKKMTDNAKEIGTKESLVEVELLKPFMPIFLEKSKVRDIILDVITLNPDRANDYKSGNKGALTGMIMKQIAGKADSQIVNQIIQEVLA